MEKSKPKKPKAMTTNAFMGEETLSPKETFIAVYKFALKKAENRLLTTFLMGITSGLFIGIAYIGAVYATRETATTQMAPGIKSLIYGIVFTIAITMIIFMGGEMFTSNSMMFLPTVKKQIKVSRFLSNLFIVLMGNFIGCTILALLTKGAGFLDDPNFLENMKKIYSAKMEKTWTKTFFSALLCNFLVAGSVYIAHSTRSSTAKLFLVIIVIMIFALSGFSHVVANSYIWVLGCFTNSDSIASNFLKFGYKIQLVTLVGNFISGGIFLPGIYYLMFRPELGRITLE